MTSTGPARRATRADLPALLTLIQSAYRGEASREGWTHEADLLDGGRADLGMLEDALTDPTTTLLVLEDPGGGLLACCALSDRGGGVTEFGTFAVRPVAQGAGTGSVLLAEAVDRARAAGATRMELAVIALRTELIAWYRRRGFEPTGRTRPFPYGDERYGLPRRDDLVFAVLARPLDGRTPSANPGGPRSVPGRRAPADRAE
ncbi:MAG: GNAT family N-acetyltransferase [Pseudonocardia sp.]